MTWVVAGNTAFFPLMVGDVRVTFTASDGRQFERDCLQKIYPLAVNLVAGFAGSVRAGMFTLAAIQHQLHQDQLYSLPQAAHTWLPRAMRRVFRSLPTNDQRAGCQVMCIGAHPLHDSGMPNLPRNHTFRFISPEFAPEMSSGRAFLSIGSGRHVEAYRAAAENVTKGFHLEMAIQGGWHMPAQSLADHLHRTVNQSPRQGISPHFVYATVSRGGPVIAPHAYTIYERDGRRRFVAPPQLARSYEEFLAFCQTNGLGATAAVARAGQCG